MSIMKKIIIFLVISLFVILCCGKVDADYTIGYDIKGSNSQSPYKNNYDQNKIMTITKDSFHNMTHFYCIDQNKHFKEGDQFELCDKYYIFRSDSDDKFERAAAYIFNEANKVDDALDGHSGGKIGYSQYYKEANGENGFTNNAYGKQVSYQGALWKLEYWLSTTGGGLKGLFANCAVKNDTSYTNTIYETALNKSKTDTECSISTSETILMENNIGTINVKSKKGTITGVKFIWDDGSEETVTSDKTGTNNIKIYSNKSCEAKYEMKVSEIKVGDFYFKNLKTNVKLAKVQISIKGAEGYYVIVHKWKPINRNDCQQLIEVRRYSSHKINNTQTKTINVKYRSLTVRKIDYDDNTLINESEFVIFEKDKGWIGYNSNNITTGNSWSNAYRFKTGTGYCGEEAYTGEFTLNNLPSGYYYIFEVATGSNLYSLKGQPGYSANSNYSFLSDDQWKMNGIESVLIGTDSYKAEFTDVGFADGTPYNFIPYENAPVDEEHKYNYVRISNCNSSFENNGKYYYATNHATLTIKNRKNTKLTIVKKDKETNTPIANVGIKVLVKTTEKRFTLNSYKWIKSDGTVTDNVNEAYEFKTDANGKIEISNVPYGKYYIFETSTSDDKYKLELQDHFMDGKPEDYTNEFLTGNYVYLGSQEIQPTTNNDINSDNYNSEVIENGNYKISSNINNIYGIKRNGWAGNNLVFGTISYDNTDGVFRFRISYVDHGYYLIEHINGFKPIEIKNETIEQRSNVIVNSYSGLDSQLWKFSKIGKNVYNIISKKNNDYGLHMGEKEDNIKNNIIDEKTEEKCNIDIYNNFNLNTQKFNLISSKKYTTPNANGNREITIEATNSKKENKGKLTIIKKDGSYSKDFNVNETLRLKGAEIKIYATNLAKEGTDKGWVQEIRNDNDNIDYIYSSYENATTFKIGDTGNIELNGLFSGNYYIYETKTPTGYPIKEQPGYHKKNEGSNDLGDIDWVFLGNTKLDDQNNDVIYEVENIWYTSLKGKVWRDVPAYKDTTVGDNVYRSNVDELMDGINVNLYNGKDELIATTTTNNNGEYEFRYKGEQNKTEEQIKDEDKLTYWELASCYVEFIYDNKDYVVVNQFVGEDKTINSKAIEETMIQESDEIDELKDEKLSGTDTKKYLPGKAVTYKGGRNLTRNEIIENTNDNNKNLATTPLTGYYNKDTYTIEDINLGLVKKPNQEIYVGENLEYVKITLNGYTYTYKYGDPEVLNSQFVPTVEKQKNTFDFYAKLYPTDVAYDATKDTEELKVYAVYSIGVENPTITQEYDTYYEKKLYLSELNATYDTDRFELSKDEIGDAEENKQFKLWRGENGQAYFNLEETEEKGNVFANGIEPNIQKELNQPSKIKTTHIQFKVKKEIIKQILSDINSVNNTEVPTKVFAKGYHEYLRTDNVWIDNKNVKAYRGVKGTYNDETNKKFYVHKSKEVKDESCGLYLKFELGEARTISGLVFEDKDEQLNDYERIGNGKYDDGETKLKNVRVSLLNESGNVVKLYNKENNSTTIKDAIDISEDGTYKLAGVLPGKYYLQFTYGNGTKVYKDINGNEIDGKAIATTKLNGENTSINTKLYKSTILTGNAKGEKNLKEEDDKDSWYQTWFINDIDKNNSVATDIDDTIKSRINANNLNTELNYEYANEGNIAEIIDAKSPKIDIKIENTDNEESKFDELPPINCSGLSFGIIERPHVNITLEKKIKNIQLTLQNGTTIINGDPADKSASQSVAKLTDSNARLELNPSYLYGSNAIVTYTLSAHNESELDYATEDYYKYGDKKDATPVTTTVTKIVDYLNNQNASYENQSNNVNEVELKEDEKNKYFSQGVISENTDYKQKVFTTDKALKPVAAVTEEHLDETCTDEYEFTVNNLLSTSDESLGWISYAEIIGMKNITVTPQSVSKSGNYVVGNIDTYEADTAIATISISPSTGENKNLIIYATIGGGLIIIALGVVLIKRFVINGK